MHEGGVPRLSQCALWWSLAVVSLVRPQTLTVFSSLTWWLLILRSREMAKVFLLMFI